MDHTVYLDIQCIIHSEQEMCYNDKTKDEWNDTKRWRESKIIKSRRVLMYGDHRVNGDLLYSPRSVAGEGPDLLFTATAVERGARPGAASPR